AKYAGEQKPSRAQHPAGGPRNYNDNDEVKRRGRDRHFPHGCRQPADLRGTELECPQLFTLRLEYEVHASQRPAKEEGIKETHRPMLWLADYREKTHEHNTQQDPQHTPP